MGSSENSLFLNASMLGAVNAETLRAARQSGFDQIELTQRDVSSATATSIAHLLQDQRLKIVDFTIEVAFDGAGDGRRASARAAALTLLDEAVRLGVGTVLVPASRHADCMPARVDDDVRWFAREAGQRLLRVAYEPTAWSTFNSTLPAAWQCLRRVHEPNIGLVVDVFHMFVRGRDDRDLDGIPSDRIFLVQLSDLNHSVDYQTIGDAGRSHRLLPGKGVFPLASVLNRLRDDDYRGPIGVEVVNAELSSQEPLRTAIQAMAALRAVWWR